MFCSFEVVIAGIFGVIFGSFSTFVGYRLFNKEHKICAKRSVCCNCGKEIKFRDLIPIFSFIFLRGKCRFCKKRIPVWHFLAEIFSSIAFIVSVLFFGGFNTLSILAFILIWCLITQSIIDYRTMMSSDVLHSIELFVCVILARLLGREFYLLLYKVNHHQDKISWKRENPFPFIPAISFAFFLAFYIIS